ncbi:hypothetical protein [Aeromicrobium sp. Leaf350]|uniref:hypothetical protein n=1 Tax=Aeromicrobium sp. Leaf350 TaxID=2876565 RepID=UPI001E298851|nr:hypothetical protein [Aeromicrobium sp. Leaf350]
MPRPSLYLTLLHRNLGEGHSWVEASDRALSGVAHAYDLVKQAVIGPPALRAAASSSTSSETPAPPRDEPTGADENESAVVDEPSAS